MNTIINQIGETSNDARGSFDSWLEAYTGQIGSVTYGGYPEKEAGWSVYGGQQPFAFRGAGVATQQIFSGLAYRLLGDMLRAYFRAYKGIISAVYRSEADDNSLHYAIVLKEDTDENRTKLFSVLDSYEIKALSDQIGVYFQFYPEHLKDRIRNAEPIVL